ncbi:MAG: MGMT family protein [Chloroflexi bacterium]|nr:MGMT family protein [Chloroflexota bacterium]
MTKARKTAHEKLETGQREIVDDPKGRGKMLIPRPLDVDAMIRKVGQGKLVTVDQLRERLAKDFKADFTCPLCTGIFLRIAAEAAEEDLAKGEKQVTPYWRVVKADGSLNEKFPGGVESQAALLKKEGHTIEPGKGKKPPRVKGWERAVGVAEEVPHDVRGKKAEI